MSLEYNIGISERKLKNSEKSPKKSRSSLKIPENP
jgi:hypothetical protein